jgi:hypothetical protein
MAVNYSTPFSRSYNFSGSRSQNYAFFVNPGNAGQGVIQANWLTSPSSQGATATYNLLSDNAYQSVALALILNTGNSSLMSYQFYVNGAFTEGTLGGGATAYAGSTAGDDIAFSGLTPALGYGQGFPGKIFYGAIWNRSLQASEARLLHDDPWCFLLYPEDELFVSCGFISPFVLSSTKRVRVTLQ